jgi:hypothetical protein
MWVKRIKIGTLVYPIYTIKYFACKYKKINSVSVFFTCAIYF